MSEEAHALARTFVGSADPNIIQVAQAQTMNREAASADVAGNLTEHIERRLLADREAENTEAVYAWRAHQSD